MALEQKDPLAVVAVVAVVAVINIRNKISSQCFCKC